MNIKIADNCGFCFGVERAIGMAKKNDNSKMVGELIHNKLVIDKLKKENGIHILSDFNEVNKNDTVIIRTHGARKDTISKLEKKDANIVDATCPFVLKLQNICSKMSKEGYEIVIFGDKNHPEIDGVSSYIDGNYYTALSVDDLRGINLKNKVALVAQTTKRPKDFEKITSYLSSKCKETRIFNTICNATFDNQDSADKLSKESDIMIVIGGKNSSNSKQLFNIAKLNCENSYFIEKSNELEKSWFYDKKNCGVTAGASTPSWLINKVVDDIKNMT